MKEWAQDHRILVADDEPEVVDLVRMVLEWEGYEVVQAADGAQALERADSDLPDLILLDVRMPKMSGLVVLEELQKDPLTAGIPVIMLSVVTTYPEVRTALQRGSVAYLPKPFELTELARLVADVLTADPAGRHALRKTALESLDRA
jgi:CheY-like chemotaxis protein